MRLAVVGNPANRRVTLFTEAVTRAGLPAPTIFPWRDVLTGGPVPGPGTTVRIDSPGEDSEVDVLLRAASSSDSPFSDGPFSAGPPASFPANSSGGPVPSLPANSSAAPGSALPSAALPGEIVGAAAAYAGLARALERVAAGGGRLLNPVGDILTMNDKRRCHALLAEAGIPVPPALPPVASFAALRAALTTYGWGRVFVKPAHGSSASGVLALAVSGSRIMAMTSVEIGAEGRLHNNLRVRRYDDEATIASIVDRLAPDGLHVERWFPKAGLGDRVLDLRVVVIAGEPSHIVARTSRTPLTNLHLGNARGEVAAVRAAAGSTAWEEAMHTCVEVARCFPRSLHVGVDLMFRSGWRSHAVAEVNAFGDLLNGQDTYDSEVAALLDGRYESWAGACVS
ncbi:STM4014 family protein [Paractinoplanes lichenicola]|uniref:STM4014 family protein n=1 Tax=Paractinoplanes lichenicola TaxID=2802976 RepID=A0ABS1VK33_9ACTN|nr:STM4014 family protein [Actinoplanes lichenicola]MBL7254990.1 STM4014 family protein [Actinoplanes lichenicola]